MCIRSCGQCRVSDVYFRASVTREVQANKLIRLDKRVRDRSTNSTSLSGAHPLVAQEKTMFTSATIDRRERGRTQMNGNQYGVNSLITDALYFPRVIAVSLVATSVNQASFD